MRFVTAKSGFVATGAVVTLAMQTPPDEAASNLSAWLYAFGIDHVPHVLMARGADWIMTCFGVFLMLFGLWVFWRDWHRHRAEAALPPLPIGEAAWVPTDAEIREECAAHGWPRQEPYLTDARDHLIFEREFNELAEKRQSERQ